ncbi:MAG: low molecular weight phosphatase family protein [Tenericutes bacterium HGW-Tenericutes-2]|nr:MAG: low molecular weight phosphatase family protein [Tenericutes bacterium HGW-Tenericutes-2]
MKKLKIAFVCVHNSCRSQMAEAITKELASDFFEAYSAGTETKPRINQDAVRIIKDLYNVDMNQTQKSKLLDDIPQELDVLVTMGCNVECPFIPTQHREDWGLDDPTGLPDEAFLHTAEVIKEKLLLLRKRIENKEIDIQ